MARKGLHYQKEILLLRQEILKHSLRISPQEFSHQLKMRSADERLVSYLESLPLSLTSNPVKVSPEKSPEDLVRKW